MSVTKQELAHRLRAAREACRMTQEDVARHLGVSRSAIAQIELGNRAVTSLELDKLAYLYGRDIRDFVADEFRAEDTLVALFRRQPDVADQDEVLVALREALALGRELTGLERVLGIERDLVSLPVYPLSQPPGKWDAIQQGERVAGEERRRLGLGSAPLPNVAELLESQGVRTAQLILPEDISGLTIVDDEVGVFVVVNNQPPGHSHPRRRFSFAHEYCHALLDRKQKGTISRASERDSLAEVRANAFAAAFLMPREGVEEFVRRLGKGRQSRLQADLYDEAEASRVQSRPEPGSQATQMHDVVLLAHHFGVSRLAALYRLKNLRLLKDPEFEALKQQEEEGLGKSLADLLDLPEPDAEEARNEFRRRFLALAFEAFRREEISRRKLVELAGMVGVAEESLEAILVQAGLDASGEGADAILPEE
jgi:Zn-dependent peptidase ImmA (M78 family)